MGLNSTTCDDRQVELERVVFTGGNGSVHGEAVIIRAKAKEEPRSRDAVKRLFNRSLGS